MPPPIVWTPGPERIASATITRYREWLNETRGLALADYADLWQWSTTDLDRFWRTVWDFAGIEPPPPDGPAATGSMPEVHWFPDASVNYARQMLRPALDSVALDAPPPTAG